MQAGSVSTLKANMGMLYFHQDILRYHFIRVIFEIDVDIVYDKCIYRDVRFHWIFCNTETVPSTLLVLLPWLSFQFYIDRASQDNETADITERSLTWEFFS